MDRLLKAARTSGSLNLSNRSLREVPAEVYQNFDGAGGGENWWETVDLQKLILAHNSIEILKEDLKNLPLLTVLNVSHNNLTQLPAAIGELPSLKSLDVSFNSLTNIAEEIGSASSLVKLDCSNNQLKELPNSLGQCLELSELKASNNFIGLLPEDLAHCRKLIKVDFEGNKLTSLPDQVVGSWSMLTELNASKNLLTDLPETIGSLLRLIRLDLHQNRIKSIPPSIKGCSSLVEFFIGSNLLSSLPPELGELSQLSVLDLRSNQIFYSELRSVDVCSMLPYTSSDFLTGYPVEACKLGLTVLDLSNNSLSGLPAEIGLMTSLRKLVLIGNPMRTIRSTLVSGPTAALLKYLRSRLPSAEDAGVSAPSKDGMVAMASRLSITTKELSLVDMGLIAVPSEVCASNEVKKVDLSKNSIEELPVALSACTALEVLILSRNKIKDWPEEALKSLPNLTCLRLDNNPLNKVPLNGFEAVPKLQILDLSGCASSLHDNPTFSSLPHLLELRLRRVKLHEVPSDILMLQKLQILDLSQNSLSSIPEGFHNLTSLTELDLSDNNISTLPPKLGLLEPSLQALRLDGNPLRSIRRTILDRGTKGVLQYLKDRI